MRSARHPQNSPVSFFRLAACRWCRRRQRQRPRRSTK